jgi:hypothetical protein
MSLVRASSGKATGLARAAVWLGLTLALQLGVAASSLAQNDSVAQRPGPSEGMRHGGGRHRMFSHGILQGPPAPEVLRDSIGLSGDRLQHYTQRYTTYVAQTRPVRDSLRTSVEAMRAAFHSGDRSSARSRRDALSRQAQDLGQRDQEFEKTLRAGLSKDQQNRYDKWKESREKAWRAEHKHGRRGNV